MAPPTESLTHRRLSLGIRSQAELAEATGMARATISKAERGSASEKTLRRLDAWLSQREQENVTATGPDMAAGDVVIEIIGPQTEWRVKVSGPPEQADLLRQQVLALIREWHPGATA